MGYRLSDWLDELAGWAVTVLVTVALAGTIAMIVFGHWLLVVVVIPAAAWLTGTAIEGLNRAWGEQLSVLDVGQAA